jgi:hypothetical protein
MSYPNVFLYFILYTIYYILYTIYYILYTIHCTLYTIHYTLYTQMHQPRITLPYCVFNGGTDAWLDVGNKSVGVAALQAYLEVPAYYMYIIICIMYKTHLLYAKIPIKPMYIPIKPTYLQVPAANCLHVGDQFTNTGMFTSNYNYFCITSHR